MRVIEIIERKSTAHGRKRAWRRNRRAINNPDLQGKRHENSDSVGTQNDFKVKTIQNKTKRTDGIKQTPQSF